MKRILFMASLSLCFIGTNSLAFKHSVVMKNLAFNPQTIAINQGDSIEWYNDDGRLFGGISHTTTSGINCTYDGTGWDSGTVRLGEYFEAAFNEPGDFPYFCQFHCPVPGGRDMVGTITVSRVVIPAPSGQQVVPYAPVPFPSVHPDPLQSRPIGIGDLAVGGSSLTIRAQTATFGQPVDIYFGVAFSGRLFFLTPTGLQDSRIVGLAPWMVNVTGPLLSIEPFGSIPVSLLPAGAYDFLLAVTPASSVSTFYLWRTRAVVP